MSIEDTEAKKMESNAEKIAMVLEKAKFGDYVTFMTKPRTLIINNFIGGVARGFGIAIGFAILGAIVLYVLEQAMFLNLPVIGGIIAEIVKLVQDKL